MNNKQLRKAFELYHQKLDQTIDQAEVEKVTLSEEAEQKNERLLERQKRFYYSLVNTAAKRVACTVAVLFLAVTVTTFSVEALREGLIHFVVELFDQGATVEMPGEPDPVKPRIPTYIPEGYRLASHTRNPQTDIRLYQGRDHKNFQFSQHPKGTNISVYTENTDYRTVTVAEQHEGILFENCGELFLIFNDGNYMYAVIGTLSEEDAMKIAASLFETR